jgi:uncharacterized protein YfiM (DUF2279 family)
MIRVAAMVALLTLPFGLERWFGADKVKHFLMSALIQSATFSVGRGVGLHKDASQIAGGAAVLSLGLWKEIQDKRASKPFSVEDLAADAAGGFAAASLLNGTREPR